MCKHNQHAKLYFSIQIYTNLHKCKHFLPIKSIYLIFFSLEMQRRLIQTKIHYILFTPKCLTNLEK